VAGLTCRRRTLSTFLPAFGQGGQQRPDALPMSQLSPSVDLESGPVTVSPRHACLRLSDRVDGRQRIFADRADRRRLAVHSGRCEQLHHVPFRHFELCDDGGLVQAVNFGPTAAHQLGGPQRGEDDELKRADTGAQSPCTSRETRIGNCLTLQRRFPEC